MKPFKFIISGGGTGGHIYPAIAIANALKEKYPNAEFLFVGAKDRMEMQKVPKAGYKIVGLSIQGLQRKVSLKNLKFPFKLLASLRKSAKIIKDFKPDVAIGTGGYASAPLLRVASNKGVSCLIQEQNAHAGITNKWIASKAKTICVAYAGMENQFPKEKIVFTGNPVRQDLIDLKVDKATALKHFGLEADKPVLLVLGGSLGARKINNLIHAHLPLFKAEEVQVIWQCGSLYYEEFKTNNSARVIVKDFIYAMDMAYAAADMIVSRAGALSVSELCLVGKPVIFIPSPNVAEDHQNKNAASIAAEDACVFLRESEADLHFADAFKDLLADADKQRRLGENIKKLAKPHATDAIVAEVAKLLIEKQL
ncbi:undecaprenyldiphospho-muramoylpentapeptide beta-N-acetylglucosaminyltransferase [Gilvibacter sp.]|uniref:undecaprenyldiphospho-muramoylpentapeptide beta-N-acetylglucosaminyltransferase n=1 Tax=Gilvibacter sp. TaxID=2729997 RepID=UPI003F49EA7D